MTNTEVLLKRLFDFQSFAQNERLAAIITDTADSYSQNRELDDDEICGIWAAGDTDTIHLKESEDE